MNEITDEEKIKQIKRNLISEKNKQIRARIDEAKKENAKKIVFIENVFM